MFTLILKLSSNENLHRASEMDSDLDSVLISDLIPIENDHSKLKRSNEDDKESDKRIKLDNSVVSSNSLCKDNVSKDILKNIFKAVTLRLNCIENKMDQVLNRFQYIDEKLNKITMSLNSGDLKVLQTPSSENSFQSGNSLHLTLNSESDFPNGSWLGNENDPEHRVRCRISSDDLIIIERSCHTPEKLALALLDFLFDRETQSCSNISGTGKHGKKQLDPLIIYGIKCHLILRYNITEEDWHKIKLNLDSKCRSVFRRKMKGMPISMKTFRGINSTSYVEGISSKEIENQGVLKDLFQLQSLPIDANSVTGECLGNSHLNVVGNSPDETFLTLGDSGAMIDINLTENQTYALELGFEIDSNAPIIHTLQGDIQVLNATPEQIAQIQKSGKIQILTADHEVLEDIQNVNLNTKWDSITDEVINDKTATK